MVTIPMRARLLDPLRAVTLPERSENVRGNTAAVSWFRAVPQMLAACQEVGTVVTVREMPVSGENGHQRGSTRFDGSTSSVTYGVSAPTGEEGRLKWHS